MNNRLHCYTQRCVSELQIYCYKDDRSTYSVADLGTNLQKWDLGENIHKVPYLTMYDDGNE